ncbi:DUF742 domain-containing protein [Actinomadura graeca]|uniref:DUF742 domain-containing protein n=2 Tax=Actinomadura graeca TaxID=2750812 RepID=A0ABX8R8Y7_9ACTN|nr:DUF742 domain-containing protein [Actinomadura graeca]
MRLDTVLTPGAAGHATGPHAAGIDDGAGAAGAPEAAHALGLCRVRDCTVAEIAATLGRPVPVTKIILSDLLDCGALAVAVPAAATDPVTGRPAPQVLEALLAGLRNHHAAV